MALSIDDVKRIAHLARIHITEAEASATLDRFQGIFSLIETMQTVDTTGVQPMAHAQDMSLRLREDMPSPVGEFAAFQTLAPAAEAGLYLVPKVVE